MEPVPSCLIGRPFTLAEAAAAGVGRRALQGPQFATVHRGVFRASETPETFDLRVRAALRILPDDAALSHQSALAWAGYDGIADETLHFSTASGTRIDRPGIVLESHLDGVQRARRIAPLVRERVDSVRESDVRWIIWSSGLPVPEPNVPILDEAGIRVAKGDLAYVAEKVIVEHDGWHHERDAAQRQRADGARLPQPPSKIWRVEPAKSWTTGDVAGLTRHILVPGGTNGLGAGGALGRG